jgi:hypothetical protein
MVLVYSLLIGFGMQPAFEYLTGLTNRWLSLVGMLVLMGALVEVMFFRIDVFGLKLTHREAVNKLRSRGDDST